MQLKDRLTQALPKTRIVWTNAFNADIIELHLEYDKYNFEVCRKFLLGNN